MSEIVQVDTDVENIVLNATWLCSVLYALWIWSWRDEKFSIITVRGKQFEGKKNNTSTAQLLKQVAVRSVYKKTQMFCFPDQFSDYFLLGEQTSFIIKHRLQKDRWTHMSRRGITTRRAFILTAFSSLRTTFSLLHFLCAPSSAMSLWLFGKPESCFITTIFIFGTLIWQWSQFSSLTLGRNQS